MAITAAPEKTSATDAPDTEESNNLDHIKALLLGTLMLAGVVVLLIFGYLTVTYRRGGMNPYGGCATSRSWGLPGYLTGLCLANKPSLKPGAARYLQLSGLHG